MSPRQSLIAEAFVGACGDELEALKPGNVHVFAAGHRMSETDFRRSAAAAAGPLTTAGARVGARIIGAIEATLNEVGTNTNLGIVLLCAPLAAAAERNTDLRTAAAVELAMLDRDDAELAFRAIVRSAPAGLGRAERYDVSQPATVSLKAAMVEAAGRDRVARQYATDFEDVFLLGEPVLTSVLLRWDDRRWATLAAYLAFLSAFPDSHIARKHGAAVAEETRHAAEFFKARFDACAAPDRLVPDLLAWDADLKRRDVNPGTSADLTVATLFVHRLRNILPPTQRSG